MLAFPLAAAFWLYWTLIGFAAIRLLGFRDSALRDTLLAPSVGLCVTLLPVFLLNRYGVPVARFAAWQTIASLVLATGTLIWVGKLPEPKWLAAFAGAAMLGLLAVAWPLLTHGFDWLANANDDMANYVLGAERFARFGYFAAPDPADILPTTRDATQWYWFLHVVDGVRPGSELLLAWALSVTGLSGVAVFMPVLAALHVSLICAAAGLVMVAPEQRRAALLTAIFVAINPMAALGNVFQLIAQDFGLSMLAATTALLCVPLDPLAGDPRRLARYLLLIVIVAASFTIVYPELIPFLVIAFAAYHGLAVLQKPRRLVQVALVVAILLIGSVALLGTFLLDLLVFLYHQFTSAVTGAGNALQFPYFLVPSGLAAFWGFAWFNGFGATELFVIDLLHSATIVAGIVMMLLALAATAWMSWRMQPVALVAAVACVLAIVLFDKEAGFGLFKLAMFAQPFVVGTLITAYCRFLPSE